MPTMSLLGPSVSVLVLCLLLAPSSSTSARRDPVQVPPQIQLNNTLLNNTLLNCTAQCNNGSISQNTTETSWSNVTQSAPHPNNTSHFRNGLLLNQTLNDDKWNLTHKINNSASSTQLFNISSTDKLLIPHLSPAATVSESTTHLPTGHEVTTSHTHHNEDNVSAVVPSITAVIQEHIPEYITVTLTAIPPNSPLTSTLTTTTHASTTAPPAPPLTSTRRTTTHASTASPPTSPETTAQMTTTHASTTTPTTVSLASSTPKGPSPKKPALPITTVSTNVGSTSTSTTVHHLSSAVDIAGGVLTRELVDRASLVAILLFGLLFFFVIVAVFVAQAYESYRKKDYTQVDYLINGMYSDSGV